MLGFVMFCGSAYGQAVISKGKPNLGRIGITFSSLGNNKVLNGNIIGDSGYRGINFYTFGISYQHALTSWLDLETGLEYSRQKVQLHVIMPNYPYPFTNHKFSIIDIPLTARVHFLKYLFANGGFLFEFDASKSKPLNSQNGLGEILGVGGQYQFNHFVGVFVNPYVKFHSNISFASQSYYRKIVETGVRFGITFGL